MLKQIKKFLKDIRDIQLTQEENKDLELRTFRMIIEIQKFLLEYYEQVDNSVDGNSKNIKDLITYSNLEQFRLVLQDIEEIEEDSINECEETILTIQNEK